MISIISAKREGRELTRGEIHHAVAGFTTGDIPDYQMSALLMAICLRGMTLAETIDLTEIMIESGTRLDLSSIPGVKLDKHSTGGVGDKATLIVAPIVAAAGMTVAKLSGRGLGHTGGTLDKLEAVPGLTTNLTAEQLLAQAGRIGLAIAGQSADFVPADKKMYALRDVTCTVASIPLIAASIVSKKIAGGADAIALDVKTGSGAFMKDVRQARSLARLLVDVLRELGTKAEALVTDMSEPLGLAVGNGLEVAEAVDVLSGHGPADVRELSIALAAHMLEMAEQGSADGAARTAKEMLDSGAAQRKLAEMIEAQGGDVQAAFEPEGFLARASHISEATARRDGYVTAIDAEAIGRAAGLLGASRTRAGEAIDPAAGVVLARKVGDAVEHDDILAVLHTSREETLEKAASMVESAYVIGDELPLRGPLVLEVVE